MINLHFFVILYMEFFDYDYLNGGISKYDTNHIHMYVDGAIEDPLSNSTNVNIGKLIHEYVHYWQHITTLFGLNICTAFAKLSILFRDFCHGKEEIKLPINLLDIAEPIRSFIEYFNRVKGDKYARCEVDDIEICIQNIAQARKEKTAVKIGAYDYKNKVALDVAFNFGYTCVIETMAHMIQIRVNPEVEHDVVPYLSGIKLYEYITGRKVASQQEEDLLITLCYGALQHDNPGVAFIEGAFVIKDEDISDWNDLYHRIMNNEIIIKGNKITFKQSLVDFLNEYEKYLQESIGTKLMYYNKVLENIKIEIANDKHLFLDMVFNGEISNPVLIQERLMDYYGYPFIEAHNIHIFPPVIDSATLRGLEILMIRFKNSSPNTTCPWYAVCRMKEENEQTVTIECRENQWDKVEKCLFTEALRYFGLSDKKFIKN